MEREEKTISGPVPESEAPADEPGIKFELHINRVDKEVEMRVYMPEGMAWMENLGFHWDPILGVWITKATPLDIYKILVYFDAAFGRENVNWAGAWESCKTLEDFRYTLRHLQSEFGLDTSEFDNPFLREGE